MYQKACCTCKVVFLLIKPIVYCFFLTFSLPCASLDLKVPNDDNDDVEDDDDNDDDAENDHDNDNVNEDNDDHNDDDDLLNKFVR